MTDTLIRDLVVCYGCDSLTPVAASFYLRKAYPQSAPPLYCGACAAKHMRGEPIPKSRFPRTAAFSLDGKTWTACDLRDAPA